MKRIAFWLIALAMLAGILVSTALASGHADEAASPM